MASERQMWQCSVYAVSDGTGNIKIGVAKDIAARMKSIQTGNPHTLQLLFEVVCVSPFRRDVSLGAHKIEHEAHRQLAHKRMSGEWFALDYHEALSELQHAMAVAEEHPVFDRYQISVDEFVVHTQERDHVWYWPTSDVYERGLVQ